LPSRIAVSAARETFGAAANTVATIKAAHTFFPADIMLTVPWWSDSNICIPIRLALLQMLESKDHQQI
jgi:hypothetical protein